MTARIAHKILCKLAIYVLTKFCETIDKKSSIKISNLKNLFVQNNYKKLHLITQDNIKVNFSKVKKLALSIY